MLTASCLSGQYRWPGLHLTALFNWIASRAKLLLAYPGVVYFFPAGRGRRARRGGGRELDLSLASLA